MKISEEKVKIELENILEETRRGYSYSQNFSCNSVLAKVIGKLETLIKVIEWGKEE